jgi:hypothetical protein
VHDLCLIAGSEDLVNGGEGESGGCHG